LDQKDNGIRGLNNGITGYNIYAQNKKDYSVSRL
jgi:hypothetical protein